MTAVQNASVVGIFDQTYSYEARVVQDALSLYIHTLTVG